MGVSVNYEGIITDIQEEKYQSGPLNSVPIRGRILEVSLFCLLLSTFLNTLFFYCHLQCC